MLHRLSGTKLCFQVFKLCLLLEEEHSLPAIHLSQVYTWSTKDITKKFLAKIKNAAPIKKKVIFNYF